MSKIFFRGGNPDEAQHSSGSVCTFISPRFACTWFVYVGFYVVEACPLWQREPEKATTLGSNLQGGGELPRAVLQMREGVR